MEQVIEKVSCGIFDVYDVAAMLIIYYRALQKKPDEEFGQIFIDEAQDFGPIVYYALKSPSSMFFHHYGRRVPKCKL